MGNTLKSIGEPNRRRESILIISLDSPVLLITEQKEKVKKFSNLQKPPFPLSFCDPHNTFVLGYPFKPIRTVGTVL